MNVASHVNLMKQMGFTEYEVKCYLALFERESLTVSEIAAIAGIPRPKAYEVLKKLLAKGLIVSIVGPKSKYTASNPEVFRQLSHDTLNNSLKQVDELASDLSALFKKNQSNSDPLDFIKIFKNPAQIHSKFLELFVKTKKEVLSFTKPPFSFASRKQMEEQFKVQIEATKRGVIIRNIYEMPPAEEAEQYFSQRFTKRIRNKGDADRVLDKLPIKLMIFDEKACLFSLRNPLEEKTLVALSAEHETLAISFRYLFESLWEKAKDYYIINNRKHHFPNANFAKKDDSRK
jgi:HTH-type transcriptional regulator, sugar sensing transcriptional regulator